MPNFILRFIFLLSFCPLTLSGEIIDVTKYGAEQYQDIFVNGKVVRKASGHNRFAEERFQILNSVLSKYSRPFTMLDVGASQGYFSFRAAHEYPSSTFVMIEGSNTDYPYISPQLRSICNENTRAKNVIWLDTLIKPKEFELLSKCEHVDVLLAQNVLHWFPNEWKKLVHAFERMSHVVVIELPPYEELVDSKIFGYRREIHDYLVARGASVLPGVPRHTAPNLKTRYYILENHEGRADLALRSMVHPPLPSAKYEVLFDYETKFFHKQRTDYAAEDTVVEWKHGINLVTYLCMKGAHPSRRTVSSMLKPDHGNGDWMPNNMILNGKRLLQIDRSTGKHAPFPYTESRRVALQNVLLAGGEIPLRNFLDAP